MDSLPEEIRSHILSLMPTKFGVQTSILSKSWRYTWTLVTNLDFDFVDGDGDDYALDLVDYTFVNRVFNSHKASKLNIFRLHFGLNQNPNVSHWVDKAVKLNVCALDMCVPRDHLPLSIFTCTTLTMLRLHHVENIWECPSRVTLPCLKTLDIIVYRNPFLDAFKLIPGCSVLETLSLQVDYVCNLQQQQPPYIFSIPTLKRFKLTINDKMSVFHKVVLRLPILEYLCVGGSLSSLYVMEDLPPLFEADISSLSSSSPRLWLQLLKGISGAKSLTTRDVDFLVRLPIFPNMKRLEVKLFIDLGKIPQFLERFPELKYICLGLVRVCLTSFYPYVISNNEFCLSSKQKSTLSYWMEPKVVPDCIRTNLTTLKYTLCKETMRYDMKFLRYILGNAEVLKTVTVTCGHLFSPELLSPTLLGPELFSLEEEKWLHSELLKFPRASMDCAIKVVAVGLLH
ncbi:putative FBD domain, leucine-rich repeat domain superfamily, F-box-like domain superfamily [Helianthus anomalus]